MNLDELEINPQILSLAASFGSISCMKNVFVTGGDGFLGSNLVEDLIARGYHVTVMVQPGRSTGLLDAMDLTQVEGDLLDQESILKLTKGQDAVIHIAAITDVWPAQAPKYWKVNVEGTQHIIEACLKNGIKRLIHCSSASVFQYGSKAQPGTEETPGTGGLLDYIDSKKKGQEVVLEAVKTRGLQAIVVNPTFMIGPKDSKPSSGTFMINAVKENLPAYTNGGKNWVYVKDVATAIANGLTQGRVGEAYILGHENLSYLEAFKVISEVTGCKLPGIKLPDAVFHAIGWLSGTAGKVFGFAPKISYPVAVIGTQGHYFSPAKAVAELGLPQTPIKQAFQESFEWFTEHQYLP